MNLDAERLSKAQSMADPQAAAVALDRAVRGLGLDAVGHRKVDEAVNLLRTAKYHRQELNYFAHPARVARLCIEHGRHATGDHVALALLHNILEVADVDAAHLEADFGAWVRRACEVLIVDRRRHKTDPGYLAEYYSALAAADAQVPCVKFFDKWDNLLVLFLNPSDAVRQSYLDEIERWIEPIVRRHVPAFAAPLAELVAENRHMVHCSLVEFLARHDTGVAAP